MQYLVVLRFATANKYINITMFNTVRILYNLNFHISIEQCPIFLSREAQRPEPSTRGPPIPFVTIVKCYILASKNFQKYSKMDFIDFFLKEINKNEKYTIK